MMAENYSDERARLEVYLNARNLAIANLELKLGKGGLQSLFRELSEMQRILDGAKAKARSGDFDGVVDGCAATRIQKERVYQTLTDSLGGIEQVFAIVHGSPLHALEKYIAYRQQQGETECLAIARGEAA